MLSFVETYKKLLLEQVATESKIIQAIRDNEIVIIGYKNPPEQKNLRTTRPARVFVYGNSKSDNKIIRIFYLDRYTDENGSTVIGYSDSDKSPRWRTMRVDRINLWSVIGNDEEDIPSYIPSSFPYKKNDKLFNNIIEQK